MAKQKSVLPRTTAAAETAPPSDPRPNHKLLDDLEQITIDVRVVMSMLVIAAESLDPQGHENLARVLDDAAGRLEVAATELDETYHAIEGTSEVSHG